jgi:thymidylate synthase (FAD)
MIEVAYVDHMGSDDRVVDAARVSFAKTAARFSPAQNSRLLSYLAEHQHWSPFAHCQATVHVRAPVMVARQLQKHTVGLAWNEVSRRYVDAPPEFWAPYAWRARAEDKKQGSGGPLDPEAARQADDVMSRAHAFAGAHYDELLALGVSPEQARAVLPQSMLTEWYWTGSLAAWARVCHLRLAPDAQGETRIVAGFIAKIMADRFPVSWAALSGWRIREEDAA